MGRLILCLFFIAITLGCANAARILDEISPQVPLLAPNVPQPSDEPEPDTPDIAPPLLAAPPTTTITVGTSVSIDPHAPVVPPVVDTPDAEPAPLSAAPAITSPGKATTVANPTASASATTSPGKAAIVANPAITSPGKAATVANPTLDHSLLSFFMHDILGGSHPSGRVVTGIVANSDTNNLPFSKANNQIFPINGGIPLNTINGVVNNNNYPFLVGLNGSPTNTNFQNSGNNNIVNGGNNNQAFVTAGQLPSGLTLQQLMFGSITVVDNEITEGHELGSSVLGKAQGFYLASSSDGSTHTLALTALFQTGGDHEIEDTISFFGIHRTATPISHIAIVGGTGKYENAKGYATIETLPHVDQHTTDGVETITHFTVYITP